MLHSSKRPKAPTLRIFRTVQINVTSEIAKAFAESEFESYRIVQDRLFESDFDRVVEQLTRDKGTP